MRTGNSVIAVRCLYVDMVNAQRVFDLAMGLMDEISADGGSSDTASTKPYKDRTLSILNILRSECYLSSEYKSLNGKRPVLPPIADFSSVIGLDDAICEGLLPYGLAAHLLLDENPALASYFNARYEELLRNYGRTTGSSSEDIERCYGGIEHGGYSRW